MATAPILAGDIKLLASKVMDDMPNGGGGPTGKVINDGASNEIFPDISELDRAAGRVNLRKLHVSVQTANTDPFLGSNVIVAQPPADPRVSITMFSTGNAFDTRAEAATRVGAYLNKGAEWGGYLYENHIAGQRIIQLLQRPGSVLPVTDQTFALVQHEGEENQIEQYVRVTDVKSVQRTFSYSTGNSFEDYQALVVSLEISDALRYDFKGTSANRSYESTETSAKVRDTLVADAATYVGVVPLRAAARPGDYAVSAASIYTQLVPSAQTETPLSDVNPMQQSVGYVQSGGEMAYEVYHLFTVNQGLFIGGSVLPGSFSAVGAGVTVTDSEGRLYSAATEVGQIDYENGIARLSTNVFGEGSTALSIAYTPAAVPHTFGPSVSVDVTVTTRSLSYVRTLETPPARGSLLVSYQVAKRWYTMRDNGQGQIRASAGSGGAGTINYETGTAVITLGALPDVGSVVLFQWTPGLSLYKWPKADLRNDGRLFTPLEFQSGLVAETVALTWNDGTPRAATVSASGALSGDATGALSGSVLYWSPNFLPPAGTQVKATYSSMDRGPTTTISSLVGVAFGATAWTYDIPPESTGSRFQVVINLDQSVEKVNGALTSRSVPRRIYLFTIGENGTILYASTVMYTQSQAIVAGVVDWTERKFTLDAALSFPSFYTEYGQADGVLFTSQMYAPTPHRIPSGGVLPLASPLYTYGDVVTGDLTKTFTVSAFQLAASATGSSATQVQATTFKVGSQLLRQGQSPGTSDKLYTNIDPATGAGPQVGSLLAAATFSLTAWETGASSLVTDWSAVLAPPVPGINSPYYVQDLTFRSAAAPLRPASVSLVAYTQNGSLLTGATDAAGAISGGLSGTVDYDNGIIKLTGGPVLDAATLRYNGVAYSYLPMSADVIGIDPVRLPSDGRVPIFRAGGIAVVGHTGTITATVTNGQTLNCGRTRVTRVRLLGADKAVINAGYTADLDAGTVTVTDISGWVQPITLEHRIEDMAVVRDAQINGDLSFTRPLTHEYPLDGSYVSSALLARDLQASVSAFFDQQTWDGITWLDGVYGNPAPATYNDALAPVVVTNAGAIPQRWALRFTSSTAFECIGEFVGFIATGNINTDFAPVNPIDGSPYFQLKALGWGSGWSAGNILRINTVGAMFPVWVVRTVQQGPETVIDDSFALLVRGDVDRPPSAP